MDKILIFDDLIFNNSNTEIIAYLLNFIIVYFYTHHITYFAYYFYSYIYNNFGIIKQRLFNSKFIYMILINIVLKFVKSNLFNYI